MIERSFWIEKIKNAWKSVSIVWLSGVRRVGKTTLARFFEKEGALYLNCDLPSAKEMTLDPEIFYKNCKNKIIIFDEIHQLPDPSRILKIGADVFPDFKILATGSSTLFASKKFSDSLTGRKRNVHMLPVLWNELENFGVGINKRLYHGGLPQMLLSDFKDPSFYKEWVDSFYARDVQKLFEIRNYEKFNLFFEYLMLQSGEMFEVSKAASSVSVSRPTVDSYLQIMEITGVIKKVRPFFGGGKKELVKTPKIYSFDTGFVSFFRGWEPLRQQDYGILWEHFVFEWLCAINPDRKIFYWRDKEGREIDFVIPYGRDRVDVFECKWNVNEFEISSLKAFRSIYAEGKNYVIYPGSYKYVKRFGDSEVIFCNPSFIES